MRRSVAALVLAATGVGLSAPSSAPAAPAPPAPPSRCTIEAIGPDTGLTLLPDVVCAAGFAAALVTPTPCERVAECDEVDVFHVTTSGWVYDGRHTRSCAGDLGVLFMSPHTAATFAPACDDASLDAEIVRPGDEGTAVMYVQIALVALGADVAVDGTYDPAMEQVVRRLQSAYELDPNGIVGPETHSLLGTGPLVSGAPSPTTTTSTTSTSTTSTTSTASTASTGSTTVVAPSGMAPGTPRSCTAAAVGADTGLAVVALNDCRAGWVLGLLSTTCPPMPEHPDAECETADVFHVERGGWVHSGSLYPYCAEALADDSGMSIHTALAWSPLCGDEPAPERTSTAPGAVGPAVRQIQIALVALGYPLDVDGGYGPRTEAAVRDFQQRNGLEVDGIAGPDTQVALGM
jgi:peptidoglycan hydrolase-like protein with peptidoglycan-binding domain